MNFGRKQKKILFWSHWKNFWKFGVLEARPISTLNVGMEVRGLNWRASLALLLATAIFLTTLALSAMPIHVYEGNIRDQPAKKKTVLVLLPTGQELDKHTFILHLHHQLHQLVLNPHIQLQFQLQSYQAADPALPLYLHPEAVAESGQPLRHANPISQPNQLLYNLVTLSHDTKQQQLNLLHMMWM